MSMGSSVARWSARATVLIGLVAVACSPSSAPSPTAAPAKPTEAAKPAESKPAAPAAAPAASPAAAAPAAPAAAASPAAQAAASPAAAGAAQPAGESLDAIYERAKTEGGAMQCYCTIATANAEKFFPVFEKRFPGIKVEQIDATSDQLVARAVAEARGGKVLGDIFQANMESLGQLIDQKMFVETTLPEAAGYPEGLKGPTWIASDLQFIIVGWNTNLVKKEDEPKQYEDLGDPKWKGKMIAEPRDLELLLALATVKYKDEEKALTLLKKIAANEPQFMKGHSELAEFLTAGQGALCLTCYSHHFPPRMAKNAPVNWMTQEGIGTVNGTGMFKGAPHPNTALLFARWMASDEGQKAMGASGRTPASPRVDPTEKTRPEKIYALGPDSLKEWPKYEKLWKDTFQIR
jgi:iron(III) transport system substrate-binding protein